MQTEVLKVIKNDNFLVFLAVWGYIPMFLGKLRSGLVRFCEMVQVPHIVVCLMECRMEVWMEC